MKNGKGRKAKQATSFNEISQRLNPIAREIRSLKQKALTGLHLLGYTLLLSHVTFIPYAYANPTGGTVVGGTGTITQSGVVTDIYQQSSSLAIDWNTYNLNSDEIVNYYQPGSDSLALNRVLSNDPSRIYGQINANGQVILVNPNGIFFGQGASINVGGLIASGLDISPDDFMNGNYIFNEVLGTDGTVINSGLINAATGGNVTLLGKQIQNQGVISANLGAVNLAAGKQAVLTFDSQGLIGVSVTQDILQNELGIDPAILNSGEINAQGGRILLTASQSQDIFSRAVNTGDLTQATSVVANADGTFDLTGGADVVNSGTLSTATTAANSDGGTIALLGQNVTSSGTITADAEQGNGGNIELHAVDTTLLTQNSLTSARAETTGQGGIIKILGDKVGLFDQSQIDVSGFNGGGQALIGGDYQGQNSLIRNASRTYIATNAQIRADALIDGDGGKIINWGNDYTWFYGSASAKGGANSGNGGFVEISGKNGLSFDGAVDTSAVNGELGTLLFDPMDIVVHGDSELYSPTNDTELDGDNAIHSGDGSGTFHITEGTLEGLSSNAAIVLEATNDITIKDLTINSGDGVLGLAINNSGSLTILADADHDGSGAFSMSTGNTIRTNGGSVSIEGATITAGAITTTGVQGESGGTVTLTSTATSGAGISVGAITTTGGNAGSNSNGENGGKVTIISAGGTIETGSITTSGSKGYGNGDDGGNAGTIGIYNSGAITVNGVLTANGGDAGNVYSDNAGAGGNITIAGITPNGTNQPPSAAPANSASAVQISGNITTHGGDVTINAASIAASTSNIDTTGGVTDGVSSTLTQDGGNIALNAAGNVSVGSITANGGVINTDGVARSAGDVAITTSSGGIAVNGAISAQGGGFENTSFDTGNGGAGGAIKLQSASGNIHVTGAVNSSGSAANGSNNDGGAASTIEFYTVGTVAIDGIIKANGGVGDTGGIGVDGTGGNVTISGEPSPSTLSSGAVTLGGAVTAYGGDVTINAASINASGIAFDTTGAGDQDGGSITLTSSSTGGGISVGSITTSGGVRVTDGVGTDSGSVSLHSDSGTISIAGAIDTTGGDASGNNNGGNAGDIDISSSSGAIVVTSLTSSGGGEGNFSTGGTAGHIDLSTGSTSTNAVTINGAVTANGGDSGSGTVGNADYISLRSDSGTMALEGNVSATGTSAADITISANALQLSTTAAQSVSGDSVDISVGAGAVQLQQNLDITATTDATISGNVGYGGTAGITLGITADNDVAVDGIGASGSGTLAVTLTADNDGSSSGNVTVGGDIATRGGNYNASGVGYDGASNTITTTSPASLDSGDVTLVANGGNISTGNVITQAAYGVNADGGDISITATSGAIDINGGVNANSGYLPLFLTHYLAEAGDINISAGSSAANAMTIDGDVTAQGSSAIGTSTVSDNISLTAGNGTMTLGGSVIAVGDGDGNVTIDAGTLIINDNNTNLTQLIRGNAVDITSTNDAELQQSLNITALTDATFTGNIRYTGASAGVLNISAADHVGVDSISSADGKLDVTLRANNDGNGTGDVTVNGSIGTRGGVYEARGVNYFGASNSIVTAGITDQNGGNVTIEATGGDISTGSIYAQSGAAAGMSGGNVSVATTVGEVSVDGSVITSGSGNVGTVNLAAGASSLTAMTVSGDVIATGASALAGTDYITLTANAGTMTLGGSVTASGSSDANVNISANTIVVDDGTTSVTQTISGNAVDITSIATAQLQQSLNITSATDTIFSGDINYGGANAGGLSVAANGNINIGAITATNNALDVILTADSDSDATGSTNINGNVATHGGNYTVSGVNYDESAYTVDTAGGDATITASGNVLLGAMNSGAGNLTVVAGGANGITQATGTNLTVTGTSDFTSTGSGADIVLANSSNDLQGTINLSNQGGVGAGTTLTNIGETTIGNANLSGDLTLQSGGNLAVGNIALTDGDVMATVNGNVTSTTASGTNISANSITLDATSNIGETGASLTTNTSMLDVRTTSGQIDMINTGNVLVEMMSTGAGDITFNNTGSMVVDRIETDIVSGTISLNNSDGDVRGSGITPDYTYADADIAGYSVDIYVNRGNLGEATRPIVIYAPGEISTYSMISFDPVFLPRTGRIGPYSDTSVVSFSATDTLAALSGEQVTEIDDLDDVDPAIFTEVHNYNLAEISIKLPKDQRYENELEQ